EMTGCRVDRNARAQGANHSTKKLVISTNVVRRKLVRLLSRVKISRFARNDNRKTDHLNLNPGWIFAEKKKIKYLSRNYFRVTIYMAFWG
ncbi:MAG TPA: hypothetical protein PLH06_00505, partial [Candidatus Hydrogenedentes bacterium]|nr:hypothetical protein [Candidatus Hydrogenedentota bacterium]